MIEIGIVPARAGPGKALRRDEVHVWDVSLERPERVVARLYELLDMEERDRAGRLARDVLQRRFVVAHGVLRCVLGGYLRARPESVCISRAPYGKPFVDGALRFNLSHSADRALIAVTAGREVGIDLERMRLDRDVMGIAGRFFSPAECAALTALRAPDRVSGFYRCWTRKEAYLKATGDGMATALDSFEVTLERCVPTALLRSTQGHDETRRWRLVGLTVGAGFEAALAVEGHGWRLLEHAVPNAGDASGLLG